MSGLSKETARLHWKSIYSQYSRAEVSAAICRTIQNTEEFIQAERVGLFFPRLWEVDLTSLWALAPTRCLFPRVEGVQLHFYEVSSLNELKAGYAGILEPPTSSLEFTQWHPLDLVLVPGYAFDKKGGRVGSGKGFYDRFLEHYPGRKWGVGFEAQFLQEELAQIPTDVRMDAVVTQAGFSHCNGEGA